MNLISRVDAKVVARMEARVEARMDIMDGWPNGITLSIYIQHV